MMTGRPGRLFTLVAPDDAEVHDHHEVTRLASTHNIPVVFAARSGVTLLSTSPEAFGCLMDRLAAAGTLSHHIKEACRGFLAESPAVS